MYCIVLKNKIAQNVKNISITERNLMFLLLCSSFELYIYFPPSTQLLLFLLNVIVHVAIQSAPTLSSGLATREKKVLLFRSFVWCEPLENIHSPAYDNQSMHSPYILCFRNAEIKQHIHHRNYELLLESLLVEVSVKTYSIQNAIEISGYILTQAKAGTEVNRSKFRADDCKASCQCYQGPGFELCSSFISGSASQL